MNHANVTTSASRKDDHVRLATEQADARQQPGDFDDVTFMHHALAAADFDSVTTETQIFDGSWGSPIYINAMTGGSASTGRINESLARVVAETGTAIASGSMSHLLKDEASASTFTSLRKLNPNGFVFANHSANATVAEARRVVDAVAANALQIHINSAQEIVMPEGDRSFGHWTENIAAIVTAVGVPVVVKEVGFGLSAETVAQLAALGVRYVDVSGRGGTNFAAIENARRDQNDYAALLSWGQSTANCLVDVAETAERESVTVLASGGVRGPLDVAKALSLGSVAVGVAGGFLHVLQREGEAALIAEIHRWNAQLRAIQALTGAARPSDLLRSDLLITGGVAEFARLRGIDITHYAQRGAHKRRSLHDG
ncbi:MAG: type 2 isopentenyl-diphosphate Delta-isomerase [Microbacteriaceae bacterium]